MPRKAFSRKSQILRWRLRFVRTEAYEGTGKDIGSTGRRQGLSRIRDTWGQTLAVEACN